MGQKKLQRFAELKTLSNALEYPTGMAGNWSSFFKNNNPITLELACGKGEYAVGLARQYAHRNFLGVDIKGNRMWVGAKIALAEGLTNVGFLRSQVEKIDDYFAPGEVEEIWITFPDPQLRFSRFKKRLTHPRFLRLYQKVVGNHGVINLKTDSPDLYEFTRQVIKLFNLTVLQDEDNLYTKDNLPGELLIQTHYEKLDIAKSNRIHYLKFKLDSNFPISADEQLKQMISEEAVDRKC